MIEKLIWLNWIELIRITIFFDRKWNPIHRLWLQGSWKRRQRSGSSTLGIKPVELINTVSNTVSNRKVIFFFFCAIFLGKRKKNGAFYLFSVLFLLVLVSITSSISASLLRFFRLWPFRTITFIFFFLFLFCFCFCFKDIFNR